MEHDPMINQHAQAMEAAFFDRLLDQQARPLLAQDEYRRQAQIFCGRWLAFRRLGLHLCLERLAEQAHMQPQTILFIETGIADHALASDDDWKRLSQVLSAVHNDRAWVSMVVSIALGRVAVPSEQVMTRVMADLNAVCAPRCRTSTSGL